MFVSQSRQGVLGDGIRFGMLENCRTELTRLAKMPNQGSLVPDLGLRICQKGNESISQMDAKNPDCTRNSHRFWGSLQGVAYPLRDTFAQPGYFRMAYLYTRLRLL